MSRKNTYFLYGAVGILLVASGVLFNHYQNSKLKEPIEIYKVTVPIQQKSKEENTTVGSEGSPLPENNTWEDSDVVAPQIRETVPPEDFQTKSEDFTDFSEPQPITQAEEPQQEDPRVTMLKYVFPEIDRNLRKGQELKEDMMEAGGSGDFAEFEARGKALESEIQGYCRQIADQFPAAVTFVTLQGQEWVYDIDFEMLQNSLEGPMPTELERYFQNSSLREMLGLLDIPADQLQQMR